MKTSLVMTTYNGEKYIGDQLISLCDQICPLDEVLIFDDGSKDNTVRMIKDFIRLNGLNNWKIVENQSNKGWRRNFIEGIDQAQGDYIFLADQDDIWHLSKVEVMSSILDGNSDVDFLMCGYQPFLDGEKIPPSIEPTYQFKKLISNENNSRTSFPGCSYCFRKEFYQKIRNAWFDGYSHDGFLYLAAWMSEKLCVVDDKLLFFRRHEDSVTTVAPPVKNKTKRIDMINIKLKMCQNLKQQMKGLYNETQVSNFEKWLSLRAELISDKKILNTLRLLQYIKFYPSLLTLLNDISTAVSG